VFSGFVSHSQLTAALGGQLAGDPVRQVLRAAAAAKRGPQADALPLATCRVGMRGPGGKGAADVAVSSFEPSTDAGHLPGGGAAASPAMAAPLPGSPGRPKLLERAQAVARGMVAAAKQAASPRGGGGPSAPIDQLHLRCGLMALQVPVEMLAGAILEGV
jgi:hypothetical protein